MKRIILLASIILLGSLSVPAQNTLKGHVVDQQGEPVPYATVALLTQADSTVVSGTVALDDGSYALVADKGGDLLMVAMLGYRTEYVAPKDGIVVTLAEDTTLLQDARITVVIPKTKLTGEGLQTSVRGSVLENAGSAQDVLAKTPGMIKGRSGLEVIGKGTPLVYINGHKVTDMSELDRLQSNEIQSIEVITNPGAKYDATVRSVVRIRTIRRQGDGFGFSFDASDAQSLQWKKGNDSFAAVNANYRTGGLDLFAGINFDGNTSRQISDADKISYTRTHMTLDDADLTATYFGRSIYGNAGVNWQMADNHFMGGKVEWGRRFRNSGHTDVHDIVYENNVKVDELITDSRDENGDQTPYNIGANLYYNGTVGEKLGVDVNFDYYGTAESTTSVSDETSSMTHDAAIRSDSNNDARMYAAKAVLSYPIWMGQFEAGTEESFTRRSDVYHITGIDIPASSAEVKENNYAGFATYGFMLPKVGMFNAGVRYEFVHYSYEDAVTPENNLARDYGHWFPNFSYAGAMGPVQMMLNYSAKTERPNYAYLSSAVRYNSRYILQGGNAQLQPELSHDVSLASVWKFVTLMVEYTRTDDAIMTWSTPVDDNGTIKVTPVNVDSPYRKMTAFVNLTPTVGVWNLNYTFGLQPQWFTVDLEDAREESGIRHADFGGKPVFFAQLFNTVTLKGGWQFELGAALTSKGRTENVYLYHNTCDISAAIQKTLLKDGSLVLRLEGRDLAHKSGWDIKADFGSHSIVQTNLMDTQMIKFSLRYNFNTAKSKYRGTGAGADNKGRM